MIRQPEARALARDAPEGARRLFVGASGTGKTALLIERLLEWRRRTPDGRVGALVWTRSPAAAQLFRCRLEECAAAEPGLAAGYRPFDITTARHWARQVHRGGRFGVPQRRIWPVWVEREAVRTACLAHAASWQRAGDRAAADVARFHTAVLQWAGTLAINDLDPARIPTDIGRSPNGRRAVDLARVLVDVAERKHDAGALGEHDLFPTLLAECEQAGVLDAMRREVRVLCIDDAQDLPVGAARLAARWAADGGELWICADPDAPTARFRAADVAAVLETFASGLDLTAERLAPPPTAPLGRRAAEVLRGRPTPPGNDAGRITCVHVADEIEEAYELARRIRHAVYARRNDAEPLRYEDCAVVAQSWQPAGAYLADAFAFYRVPVLRRVGTALINAPVVQYALAYLRSLEDGTLRAPPRTLLASGFAGPQLPAAAVHVLWRDGQADAHEGGGPPRAATRDTDGPAPTATRDALEAWIARWRELRAEWRRTRRLTPLLHRLARDQLLPVLGARDYATEIQPQAFAQLAQFLELVDTLERDAPADADAIGALHRAAAEEKAAEEWDAGDGVARDAVHIVTPYAARDLRFRWMALAGFTSGRWPPAARPHLLRLDRPTAAWHGAPPLTLWAPDAETHYRDWRQLAAATFERCDGDLVITVPREGEDGAPLEAAAWLDELGDLLTEEPPLADPARGLALDAALTPAEAAAALRAFDGPDDALHEARGLLDALPVAPSPAGGTAAVDLGDRTLSASLLNAYLACPRKCFYTRLLRVEEAEPVVRAAGTLGSIVHAVLQQLHAPTGWRRWSKADADAMHRDATGLLDAAWSGEAIATAYPNRVQRERMAARAGSMLERYVRWAAAEQAGVEVVATEAEFTVPLGTGILKGYIDRIDRLPDGRLRIVDYKTSRGDVRKRGKAVAARFAHVDGKPDWRPTDLQLPAYQLGSAHVSGAVGTAAETALCYVNVDAPAVPAFPTIVWDGAEPPDDKARFVLDENAREQACTLLEQTADRVLRGEFPATPANASQCARCAARTVCPSARLDDAAPEDGP